MRGYTYMSNLPSMLKYGFVSLEAGKACVCGEKAVSISCSIIQSNAICQIVSLGPQRDRQDGNASVCFALRHISPVNLLILFYWC